MREITFGSSFGAALHEDGRVRVWGRFSPGIGAPPWWVYTRPTLLAGLSDVRSIGAGGAHLVAVKNDGTVWIWGQTGLVTDPAPVDFVPRRVEGIDSAVWARAGWARTFVALADGRVLGFGGVGHGVFGDTNAAADEVVEVPELRDVRDVRLGLSHGLALHPDGSVSSWGSNFVGQLGDPAITGRFRPGSVPGLTEVTSIEATFETSLALRADGSVWIWGRSQVLLPDDEDFGLARSPYRIPGLERIQAIASSTLNGYALRDDGVLFGWGEAGGVGDGALEERSAPVPVALAPVARIYAGVPAAHAITADGLRWAWRPSTNLASLGDGTLRSTAVPAPVPIYSE